MDIHVHCCKCGRISDRATRFVCLCCEDMFCKTCYNERDESNSHKNHPIQQVLSKSDLELFYGGGKKNISALIKDQPITCPCCGEKGLSSPDLIEHMVQQHSKNPNKVLCPLCLCGFENISNEAEFYGRNIVQHLCVGHQLMPYNADDDNDNDDDDEDDDDGEEHNDNDDDDDDYDDPHEMPGENKVESRIHSTGQKRHLPERTDLTEAGNGQLGPAGDGYTVRKSITFLNIEGEPFTFGDECDPQPSTTLAEVGAGDSRQVLNTMGMNSIQVDMAEPLLVQHPDRNGFGDPPAEDSNFTSTSRTGLIRRNAMKFFRGQGSRQRSNNPLSYGRGRFLLNNCDAWDVGSFIAAHDHASQRSLRGQSRCNNSKTNRGGTSSNLPGTKRAEQNSNFRQNFDDLLNDCLATNILRDSGIATELLTYMDLRKRREGHTNNSVENTGMSSFEEQRLESERAWKNFKRLEGIADDQSKEKKQCSSDISEQQWARALDFDGADYLDDHDVDEFYDGADDYEFFDAEDEDDYDDDDDNDDDDDDDTDTRANRFCDDYRNMKERNIIKLVMSHDKSKSRAIKQQDFEMTDTGDAKSRSTKQDPMKKSNEDEKFLLGMNFWKEYHEAQQQDCSENNRINESLFIQELLLSSLNIIDGEAEDHPGGVQGAEVESKSMWRGEEKDNRKKGANNKGSMQIERKVDGLKSKKKLQNNSQQEKGEKLVQVKEGEVKTTADDASNEMDGKMQSSSKVPHNENDLAQESGMLERPCRVRLESKPSKGDVKPASANNSKRDDLSANQVLDLGDRSEVVTHQTIQNNYGARPKDRSYKNPSSRNPVANASSLNFSARKPNARRASSGFVSASSKASSSSSSLLSTNQEVARKRSSKNSSAVSSSSNLSDFSSTSAGLLPVVDPPISGFTFDEAGGYGEQRSDDVLSTQPHFQSKQVRSDSHHPPTTTKLNPKTPPSQTNNSQSKRLKTVQQISSQTTSTAIKTSSSLANRGVIQQQQGQQRATRTSVPPGPQATQKPAKPSDSTAPSQVNSPSGNPAAVHPAANPTLGSSSSNSAAENSRSNKSNNCCNNSRNKNVHSSQKDKTNFR